MHSDGKKRCSFVALLFAAGDLRRSGAVTVDMIRQFPLKGILCRTTISIHYHR